MEEEVYEPDYDYLLGATFVGKKCTGKTSLIVRFTDDTFLETYASTNSIDFKIRTLHNVHGKIVKMRLLDTMGDVSWQRIGKAAYTLLNLGHAFVFVYDITNKQSFDELPALIREYKSLLSFKKEVDYALFVIGTKCDLEEQRAVLASDAEKFAEDWGLFYLPEVSALKSTNVEEAFDRLAALILVKMDEITFMPPKSARVHSVSTLIDAAPSQKQFEWSENSNPKKNKSNCNVS